MNSTLRASATRRVGSSGRHRTRTDYLRVAWYGTSDRSSWPNPDDWWHPAVDALLIAIVRGKEIREPCAWLGRARAAAGLGVGQTIDDLHALYRHLPDGAAPTWVIRILVDAWQLGSPS